MLFISIFFHFAVFKLLQSGIFTSHLTDNLPQIGGSLLITSRKAILTLLLIRTLFHCTLFFVPLYFFSPFVLKGRPVTSLFRFASQPFAEGVRIFFVILIHLGVFFSGKAPWTSVWNTFQTYSLLIVFVHTFALRTRFNAIINF